MALQCPRCSAVPFSALRLLSLGPLRAFPCRGCGTRLSVGWLMFLPFLIVLGHAPVLAAYAALFYAGFAFGGFAAFIAFIGAGLLIGAPLVWLYARLVTLVPRDSR
jgi:hypothetical protein